MRLLTNHTIANMKSRDANTKAAKKKYSTLKWSPNLNTEV
jgi:hypothetical protein